MAGDGPLYKSSRYPRQLVAILCGIILMYERDNGYNMRFDVFHGV